MQQSVTDTTKAQGFPQRLRAVLFDMDGVLYNSMPSHAKAWHRAMAHFGYDLPEQEAYMHEGRTGASTINIVSRRQRGVEESEERIQEIYRVKSQFFNEYPPAEPMPGALELLRKLQAQGLKILIVTGSGQASLLDRLNHHFPGVFCRELMVTAFDVQRGKPDPEPYLMGLQKGGLRAEECVVVENAPLGVRAAKAAGIFTIAVNTGPLPDEALINEGADLLLPSMQTLCDVWEQLNVN
ncbi:MAG: HAD-IA family hydrolase [Bacteroidaceae bacterium]|nr:HAD-IA family hydrolase [Bacteroidaceae bacterium]MBR3985464.1 HAD-IA family hydrolase [Bacteroidaceae bacterium]